MPNATGLTNNKIAMLAKWNNMLRQHYNEERKASQGLPGPTLPALPNNANAVNRNKTLIRQAQQNVGGVPPTLPNAKRVANIANENKVLAQRVVPAAVAVNNNALKLANKNNMGLSKMFGN